MKKIIVLLVLICMTASAWAALPPVELLPMRDLRVGFGFNGGLGNNSILSWERDGDFDLGLKANLWHVYESRDKMMDLYWGTYSEVALLADMDSFNMGDLVEDVLHIQDARATVFPLAGSPLLGFGGDIWAKISYDTGKNTVLDMSIAPRVQFGRIYDASKYVKAYLAADLMDRPNADLR